MTIATFALLVLVLGALAALPPARRRERRAGRLEVLGDIDRFGAALAAARGFDAVVDAVARAAHEVTGGEVVVGVVGHGRRRRVRAADGGLVLVPDVDEPAPSGGWSVAEPIGIDGVQGQVVLRRPAPVDGHDRALLASLVRRAEAAIGRALLVDDLSTQVAEQQHASHHDALTGLPNRVRIRQVLDDLLEGGRPGAVLLVDLDRFKEINDTLGHHTGDDVLCEVARRLVDVTEGCGFTGRLGGDEFATVVPDVDAEGGLDVARRIRAALLRPMVIDGMRLDVSGSVGVAVTPQHGTSAARLLKRADVALYAAKDDLDGVVLHQPSHDRRSRRRVSMVARLREAIAGDELLLHYQPQIDLGSGAVVGVEALLRWHTVPWGDVDPQEVVDVAEHAGLVGALTRWALDRAVADGKALHDRGWPLHVAVNLSVRDLPDRGLVAAVADTLARTGFPASHLTLELTETSMMTDVGRASTTLGELAGLGVTLSIDDFGTGHSSLARLARLPVGEVKIDRGFVRRMADDPADDLIVQATIQLGRNLGLRVVAEGVETEEAAAALRAHGCTLAQGYLFAPPTSLGYLTYWLARHPGPRLVDLSEPRSATPA